MKSSYIVPFLQVPVDKVAAMICLTLQVSSAYALQVSVVLAAV